MSVYLSKIELYYTKPENINNNIISIDGLDFNHITKVMRHKIGDIIYVTDGEGNIYNGGIESINKILLTIKVTAKKNYINRFNNITVCIANLKKTERIEFAIEKATEIGITNFIIFNSKRTIQKKIREDRLNKISLSAMKQSLNSHLPKITIYNSLSFLNDTNKEIILFDQESKIKFSSDIINLNKNYFLLFGPEGGFEEEEIPKELNKSIFNLAPNRLRTETAVVCAVSKLLTYITQYDL